MKNFPSFTDLSEEQLKIYDYSLDIPLLITGGPGTGKTVMALWRSANASKNHRCVRMCMFNNTLLEYTTPFLDQLADEIDSDNTTTTSTQHAFISSKYQSAFNQNPPMLGGSFDYDGIFEDIRTANSEQISSFFDEYFILDEGQDFPSSFYKIIGEGWRQNREVFCPTILADENQQLTEGQNSSIQEIKDSLGVMAEIVAGKFGEEHLTKNYRNPREIALFANNFFDYTTAQPPSPPDKSSGSNPIYENFDNFEQMMKKIIGFCNNHPQESIGILIPLMYSSRPRKRIAEYLRDHGDEELNERLQTYGKPKAPDINHSPIFDGNQISVLTKQSSKGLEFDYVFLPHLESIELDEHVNVVKRGLYVLSTRARQKLFLYSVECEEYPPVMREDFFIKARDFMDLANDDEEDSLGNSVLEIKADISTKEEPLSVNDQSDAFDSERFFWKKTESNGISETWHYLNELSKNHNYIDLIIFGGSEAKIGNYWKKLRTVNNMNSNNFILNMKPTIDQVDGVYQFHNGKGCIVSLRSSKNINISEPDPLIILNLEDVGEDPTLQNELINILNSVKDRIYLLYCFWNEGDSEEPINLVKQTNNSKELPQINE